MINFDKALLQNVVRENLEQAYTVLEADHFALALQHLAQAAAGIEQLKDLTEAAQEAEEEAPTQTTPLLNL